MCHSWASGQHSFAHLFRHTLWLFFFFFFLDGVKLIDLLVDTVLKGSNAVRLYWPESCTDGLFLRVDGVDFLYRRCHFMHAGLRVLCFGFGVCWALTFAAAMLFSSSAVTWLVGCVGYVLTNSATFDILWPLTCCVCLRGFKSFLPSGECRTLYNQILIMIIILSQYSNYL